jgi:hypothetical protein
MWGAIRDLSQKVMAISVAIIAIGQLLEYHNVPSDPNYQEPVTYAVVAAIVWLIAVYQENKQ